MISAGMILSVAAGGAVGASLRYLVTSATTALIGHGFPWGTLLVNVAGSLVMGVLIGLFAHSLQPGPALRAFLVTGLLGGFTTFSAFSLDAVTLIQRGEMLSAGGYMVGSVVFSVGGLFLGLLLARSLLSGGY